MKLPADQYCCQWWQLFHFLYYMFFKIALKTILLLPKLFQKISVPNKSYFIPNIIVFSFLEVDWPKTRRNQTLTKLVIVYFFN